MAAPARQTVRSEEAAGLVRRLWALAAICHVVGNPAFTVLLPRPTLAGVTAAGLAVAAFAVLRRPANRLAWPALAVLGVALTWFELPTLPSHWVLGGLVSLAIAAAAATKNPTEWFERTARLLLLSFYAFAAFAKLNTGFLDPAVSCAVLYTNQTLESLHLPTVSPTGPLAVPVALGTIAIELSVPVLLLRRRTRTAGAVLGMAFHMLVSLDLGQHFYDFTSVLLALFVLFLPTATRADVAVRLRVDPLFAKALAAAAAAVLVLTHLPGGGFESVGRFGAFVLWLPFCAWFAAALVGALRATRPAGRKGAAVAFRPPGVVAAALVLVTLLNGLAPYLELKTASAFNMYSNLVTENGRSNHLVIRRAVPLTDGNKDPIEVLATKDPGLSAYARSGFRPTEDRFFHYLAEHPEVTVTYRQSGVEHTVTGAEAGRRMSLWAYKFVAFRALAPDGPPACQVRWFVAL